jgi:flagellar hook-associated protein 3 FlgL
MFIRSTFSGRLGYLAQQTTRTSGELMRVNEQVATGKKINQLSDAPFSTPLLHNLRQAISEQQEYQRASNTAVSLQYSIEGALEAVENIVSSGRELATQYANDTFSAEQRAMGIAEVDTMLQEILGLSNTQFMNRYVFSGTGYDIEPFDSTFTYQSSSNEMTDRVSQITSVTTGMVGTEVFQGNIDIFQTFQDLSTALQNNDSVGIRDTLEHFITAVDQVATARAKIGTNMKVAVDMFDISSSMEEHFAIELSNTEDADMAKVLARFSEVQTQYDINIQLTSSNRSMNLFQRM